MARTPFKPWPECSAITLCLDAGRSCDCSAGWTRLLAHHVVILGMALGVLGAICWLWWTGRFGWMGSNVAQGGSSAEGP